MPTTPHPAPVWRELCPNQHKLTQHRYGLVLESSDKKWVIETECAECRERYIITRQDPPAGYQLFQVRFVRQAGRSSFEGIHYEQDDEELPVLARDEREAYYNAIELKTLDFQLQLITIFINGQKRFIPGDGPISG